MNTPLGVQGKEHQDRRDAHERFFAKTYGLDKAKTPEEKAVAHSKARQRIAFVKARQTGFTNARKLLAAGGH